MASAELRIINRRIKSVKSTKKITRAMELIASSRIVKAQQRLTSSNNYTNLLAQIVEELTGSGEMPTSPAIEGTKKITLVVITSDRGLAGAYNTNILKLAEIRKGEYENLGNQVEIVTVGKKANGYFKYRNVEPKQNYEGITDEPNFENAYKWFNIAVALGIKSAKIKRDEMIENIEKQRLFEIQKESIKIFNKINNLGG